MYDEFLEKVIQFAKAKKVGDPFEEGTENGPCISEKQIERI